MRAVGDRVLLLLALLFLLDLMDVIYVNFVVMINGELAAPGYPWEHRDFLFRALGWSIGLLPALWMPMRARRPSHVLSWIMYLMVILPTTVVGVYATQSTNDIIAMLTAMVAGLGILCAAGRMPPMRLPVIAFNARLFWLAIIVFTAITYVSAFRTFGATFRIVSLAEIYEQRLAAEGVAAGSLTVYLVSWQRYVLNPFVMAYAVVQRRPWIFVLGVVGQVVIYGIAAERVVLATPFIVLGFHFLLRGSTRRFALRIAGGSLGAFVSLFALVAIGGALLSQIAQLLFQSLLSRLFLNTGFITVIYFKFFQTHPHVGFAETKPFGLFFTSPYNLHYPVVLGYDVWGRYNDPNANPFADGFAQFGYSGLFIEVIVLAFAFWLLDCIARQRRVSVWLVAMMCAGQVPVLVNAPTSVTLFSFGFGVVMLLVAVLPRSLAARSMARAPKASDQRRVPGGGQRQISVGLPV